MEKFFLGERVLVLECARGRGLWQVVVAAVSCWKWQDTTETPATSPQQPPPACTWHLLETPQGRPDNIQTNSKQKRQRGPEPDLLLDLPLPLGPTTQVNGL